MVKVPTSGCVSHLFLQLVRLLCHCPRVGIRLELIGLKVKVRLGAYPHNKAAAHISAYNW